MKKIILSVFILLSLFILTGCGTKNVEGNLEDLMTKVYANLEEDEKPMMLQNTVVNEENIEYFLGTADIEYKEALASEPAIGSIAHSVVLIRAKDSSDVENIKTKIKENVNPRKWVCVGVEEDEVIIKSKGDLIILIIAESNREKLEQGFDNL